jgi:hypothetical protein
MLSVNPLSVNPGETVQSVSVSTFSVAEVSAEREAAYAQYKIIRRNGAVVGFEPPKIAIAMTKAFIVPRPRACASKWRNSPKTW